MQIRTFSDSNLDKLDKLLKYLEAKKISYCSHYIGMTKKQLEMKEIASKDFDASKAPLIQISWWDQ